jgi:hypothetical protein
MAAQLDYVRLELFDKAVDRHHHSYVSAVLARPLGAIRCRMTHTLPPIHPRWIPKYVIHMYYFFLFFKIVIVLSKLLFFSGYPLQDYSLLRGWLRGTCYELRFPGVTPRVFAQW